MSALSLSYEACVRSLSVQAACTTCKDTCPTSAITLDGPRDTVQVLLSDCTSCGLCAAACPTDAFEAPFALEAFVKSTGPELRCGQDGLPCVGALSTEDLIAIAARHKVVTVLDGACASRTPGHALTARRVQEAQFFCESVGVRSTICWTADPELGAPQTEVPEAPKPPKPAPDEVSQGRRQLLRMLVPPLEKRPETRLTHPDRLDRDKMQTVPQRRRRMLAALPSSVEADPATFPQGKLGFFSTKDLNAETCTACSVCVAVCPTGALQAPRSMREIRFDTSRCTKCKLCHDVCDPGALTVSTDSSLTDFLDFAPRMLSRLAVAACGDCGLRFRKTRPDQGLCPRCEDMDQEVLDLAGIQR